MTIQYILGINCAYHESSACIIVNGELLAAAEEERFNRIKHGKPAMIHNADSLPLQAIAFCLQHAGLKTIANVQDIAYSFNAKRRFKKNSTFQCAYPIADDDFGSLAGEKIFYSANMNVENKLKIMGFKGAFHALNHHDCHAASAFYVSGYDDAAVLVIDGIGEFESTTLYHGKGNRLSRLAQLDFPDSLGLLWEKISLYMGFSIYDAAKTMGLSSYGDPTVFQERIEQILTVHEDGTFSVHDDIVRLRNDDCSSLEQLFGLPTRTEPVLEMNELTQGYADVAVALQIETEKIFIQLAKNIQGKTGANHLCVAGGVALNCVANGYLSYAQVFKNFYVQPAANDAGTSIGAAYIVWHHVLNKPRLSISASPYMGPEYSNEIIESVLNKHGLVYEKCDNIEVATAVLLTQGKVISWFQGRMELGPRALGNRSLLADPRQKKIVTQINVKVKHREAFRPFCPSILVEKAYDWFELPEPLPSICDYMLGAFRVLPDKKDQIPAVVHTDGTCRIQTVHQETNPRYHRLLREMERLTGVPILLNTSFNDREPLVCSPDDAVHTFMKTEIDALAIGDFLVHKTQQCLK
ncbi:MAG: carbamoyltransferase C-terminal domain-containing protein [Mariprofundaceae bacterium]|nr:carbamoyltransferase C-terminal domain-containing protein [Mariprofundaceae bacterium]